MIIIVTGGRELNETEGRYLVYDQIARRMPDLIVQGGCPTGADLYAREHAGLTGVKCQTCSANWRSEGRSAGPKRNGRMLAAYPDAIVLAFPRGGPGTADCIKQANALEMKVWIY